MKLRTQLQKCYTKRHCTELISRAFTCCVVCVLVARDSLQESRPARTRRTRKVRGGTLVFVDDRRTVSMSARPQFQDVLLRLLKIAGLFSAGMIEFHNSNLVSGSTALWDFREREPA